MAQRRRLAFTAEQIAKMVQLYEHGWSCDRLAARFGCLSGSVHRRLVSAGVTMRPLFTPRRRQANRHSNGYIRWGESYVHRIVAEAMLERPLRPGEAVHHKNGDKTDNRPDNLEVFESSSAHMKAELWRTWWTDDRIGVLMAMRAAGATAQQIADAMHTTKAAVDNKARDLVAAGLDVPQTRRRRIRIAAETERLWAEFQARGDE